MNTLNFSTRSGLFVMIMISINQSCTSSQPTGPISHDCDMRFFHFFGGGEGGQLAYTEDL